MCKVEVEYLGEMSISALSRRAANIALSLAQSEQMMEPQKHRKSLRPFRNGGSQDDMQKIQNDQDAEAITPEITILSALNINKNKATTTTDSDVVPGRPPDSRKPTPQTKKVTFQDTQLLTVAHQSEIEPKSTSISISATLAGGRNTPKAPSDDLGGKITPASNNLGNKEAKLSISESTHVTEKDKALGHEIFRAARSTHDKGSLKKNQVNSHNVSIASTNTISTAELSDCRT